MQPLLGNDVVIPIDRPGDIILPPNAMEDEVFEPNPEATTGVLNMMAKGCSVLCLPFTVGLSFFIGQWLLAPFVHWGVTAFSTPVGFGIALLVVMGIFASCIGGYTMWACFGWVGERIERRLIPKSGIPKKNNSSPLEPVIALSDLEEALDRITTLVPGLSPAVQIQLRWFLTRLATPRDINRGVVLHGVSGSGKSTLALAIAATLCEIRPNRAKVRCVRGPDLLSCYHGDSEKNVRELFKTSQYYRIVIMDEIDAIAPRRRNDGCSDRLSSKVVSQLLTMMSGLQSNPKVIMIGTTNLIEDVDDALLREGRLGIKIHVDAPNTQGRLAILQRCLNGHNLPLPMIAEATEGCTAADLTGLIQTAKICASIRGGMLMIEDFHLSNLVLHN